MLNTWWLVVYSLGLSLGEGSRLESQQGRVVGSFFQDYDCSFAVLLQSKNKQTKDITVRIQGVTVCLVPFFFLNQIQIYLHTEFYTIYYIKNYI